MLQELLCLIADAVPIRLLFDELMKAIGDVKFVVETIGSDRKGFAARCDLTQACAAVRAEATIVFVGCFWLVCDYGIFARD